MQGGFAMESAAAREHSSVFFRAFAVLGQDARLPAAAAVLAAAGHRQLPAQQLAAAGFVLLAPPLPALGPYAAALAAASPGTVLLAGGVGRQARAQAAAASLPVLDYMQDEALALANAIPTAEGAIGILLSATPETLWRARVLVLGYGRCAAALALRLAGLGACVTVAARSAAALGQAALANLHTAPLTGPDGTAALPALAAAADIVVNTVPAPLITRQVLAALRPGAFVLDLASAPGGVDQAAAAALGVAVRSAPGLPGAAAPAFAGRAIGQACLRLLAQLPAG